MSPLQLAVYWRIALIFVFLSFVFYLDIFSAATLATVCHHGINGTWTRILLPRVGHNQSRPGEAEADWTSERENRDSVCAFTDWLPYGQTLMMVGLLLGSLFGGVLADRYGKRLVLLVFVCVQTVCGLVPAVLPLPLVYLAVRCLTGVCGCCINICCFCLVAEWTLPAARLWPMALIPVCFSLGTMGGAPLAWLSPTWTQLHLSLALPQVVCLPLFLSIPESPSWLMLKRRLNVLERYRGNSPADKHCLDQLLDSDWSDLHKATEAQKELPPIGHAPSDIIHLRHPTILLRLFIMSFLNMASSLTYFGICMNIGSFGVGVYSAQFFSGLSEVPCLLIPLIRLGRRPLSMLALFLSGTSCFLSLMLSRYNGEPVLVMSLALLGKLCILAAIFIYHLYSIELFPTAVSLVNSFIPPNPNGAISLAAMVLYSSGPIMGCGLCLLLPETSGIPLPDSVEDCERQPRPRPPSFGALWKRRKLVSEQTRPTEVISTEKDNTLL